MLNVRHAINHVVSPMSGGALLGVCRGRSVSKCPSHFTEFSGIMLDVFFFNLQPFPVTVLYCLHRSWRLRLKGRKMRGLDYDFTHDLTSILAFLMIS